MKTKGGRSMNPTDAYRKQARKREIKRNKAERTFIRDAFGKRTQAAELKSELEELIAQEETAEGLSKLQKLRKKVVLEAYEAAIRKQKEEDLKKRQAEEEGTEAHGGLSSVPLPKPPPLPAGPKPGLPPPPGAPPLPPGPADAGAAAVIIIAGIPVLPPPPGPPPPHSSGAVLPPPAGPPPGAVLPPPPGPPPGFGMLPPPPGGPPGMLPPGMLPPPSMLPPPLLPPPGAKHGGPGSISKAASGAPTITGASTVAKRPLAHKDKALTSMVPASVLVRREAAAAAAAAAGPGAGVQEVQIGPGFGLAPVQKSAVGGLPGGGARRLPPPAAPPPQGKWGAAVQVTTLPAGAGKGAAGAAAAPGGGAVDQKLAAFMDSLKDLGAFE